MIEILSTGLPNSIQDLGRPGHLASGVSIGGAMDRLALMAANILVGNDRGAAGLEIALFPFRLRVDAEIAVAVTGADCGLRVDGLPFPPWWAFTLRPGQTLAIEAPEAGARAYMAFAGGIDVPEILGSRSTDLRGGYGGLAGKGLSRGDRFAAAPSKRRLRALETGYGAVPPPSRFRPATQGAEIIPLRVLPAAEHDAFTQDAGQAFLAAEWAVTVDANRMGYRLAGPSLHLRSPVELLSHGILPGVIQVPSSGQPMIQLADANTCGGYPKIASVIEADLGLLAQALVGAKLRFHLVSDEAAVEAARQDQAWLAELTATAALLGGGR